jgi:hypothetical protein
MAVLVDEGDGQASRIIAFSSTTCMPISPTGDVAAGAVQSDQEVYSIDESFST